MDKVLTRTYRESKQSQSETGPGSVQRSWRLDFFLSMKLLVGWRPSTTQKDIMKPRSFLHTEGVQLQRLNAWMSLYRCLSSGLRPGTKADRFPGCAAEKVNRWGRSVTRSNTGAMRPADRRDILYVLFYVFRQTICYLLTLWFVSKATWR